MSDKFNDLGYQGYQLHNAPQLNVTYENVVEYIARNPHDAAARNVLNGLTGPAMADKVEADIAAARDRLARGNALGVASLKEIPEEVWERLREAEKVDESFLPRVSLTDSAVMADVLSQKYGIKGWAPFERAWGIKSLRNYHQKALASLKYDKVKDELCKIIGC